MIRPSAVSPAPGPPTSAPAPASAAPPVGRHLALTAKAVREWFEASLSDEGGSLPMWIVLSQAAESSTPPSQRELAARMHIGGATLVRHLDRMEADGLVRRTPDLHDRRITRIGLTAAGRRRHHRLAAVAARLDDELRSLMSTREEQVLRRVLTRVSDHVSRAHDPDRTDDETDVA